MTTNLEQRFADWAEAAQQTLPAGLTLGPIDPVSRTIHYALSGDSNTPINHAIVQQRIAAFDWTERRPRSIAAIESDLDGATNAELLRFLKRLIAEHVQASPKWLRRLNKAIDGDELA